MYTGHDKQNKSFKEISFFARGAIPSFLKAKIRNSRAHACFLSQTFLIYILPLKAKTSFLKELTQIDEKKKSEKSVKIKERKRKDMGDLTDNQEQTQKIKVRSPHDFKKAFCCP